MSNADAGFSRRDELRMPNALPHLFLVITCLIIVYPVFVMISGSFKSISELFINSSGLPLKPTLDNYTRLLNCNSGIISRTFMNSLFIASSTTILQLLVASMAGFAFSSTGLKAKTSCL